MSNDDARLHGHGGGVVTGVIEALIRAATCACVIAEEGKCDVCLMTIKEAKALLASNPSPEPVDAEVREAVEFLDGIGRTPESRVHWETIKSALRSQAGQGRVVTAEDLIEAIVFDSTTGTETVVDVPETRRNFQALLAAQEPREEPDTHDASPVEGQCCNYASRLVYGDCKVCGRKKPIPGPEHRL